MEKPAYKNIISTSERKAYIAELKSELPFLRMKAGVSQDELACIIGVSRQTYGAIERGDRPMGWTTYLSLIFFFDNKIETRDLVRTSDAYPHKFVACLNVEDTAPEDMIISLTDSYPEVFEKLDDRAVDAIRTHIMIEYARCTNQEGASVVRSFDGMNFMRKNSRSEKVDEALKKIKGKSNG